MDPFLPPPIPPVPPTARTSALAVWSLVLGLLGAVLCVPALPGLICGIIALVHINKAGSGLRGRGLAIAGIAVSFVAPFVCAVAAAILVPMMTEARAQQKRSTETLDQARAGFITQLEEQERDNQPVVNPPANVFQRVTYRAPLGEFPAYLSLIPDDGKKHPAIIWLVGGMSNGISSFCWDPAPPENDQSARFFREAGVVTLYPSLRGGNGNPGFNESFFGEVNDVLAAADFLAKQPGIDPERIYLGGHSTGGTLALLVTECTSRFRAVFSFGPVARVGDYGADSVFFDLANDREAELRNPIDWLHGIKTPTFVFEGDQEPCNIVRLRQLARVKGQQPVKYFPIPGGTHFTILAPISRQIAAQIIADTGPQPQFDFSRIKIAQ